MRLANRIREIRELSKLTQAEVAYRIGISPSAYGQIERKAGKSTFETLEKVAEAIGVSIAFLVDVDKTSLMENEKNKL